jgi:hypothetical protein
MVSPASREYSAKIFLAGSSGGGYSFYDIGLQPHARARLNHGIRHGNTQPRPHPFDRNRFDRVRHRLKTGGLMEYFPLSIERRVLQDLGWCTV